jgi:uncharacterized membrane protein YczE
LAEAFGLSGRDTAVVTRNGLVRRLTQLYIGLILYGASCALMVRAHLGLDPWDVFHQGVSRLLGWSIGTVVIVIGALVLLWWIPLRQRPGLGTVSNVVLVGVAIDGTLAVVPTPGPLALRISYLVAGIVLCGLATGLYIGAELGPGPRDGLMTGLVRRTGWSIRSTRTGIEASVLLAGFFLGGSVGVGTVAFALAIGPLAQVFVPLLSVGRTNGTDLAQSSSSSARASQVARRSIATSNSG